MVLALRTRVRFLPQMSQTWNDDCGIQLRMDAFLRLGGEAIVLGLASGPACVASCGPVLVPALLAKQGGVRGNTSYLSVFLGSRFVAYLLFALLVGEFGAIASAHQTTQSFTFGVAHVLLAVVLVWYARSIGRSCAHPCASLRLVNISTGTKQGSSSALLLGFLTGVSLCPPFIAAGIRAAELENVVAALLFFAAFFVGTSVWFVPFVGVGCIRRNEAIITVARMAMVLIAFYYGFLGVTTLLGSKINVF